MTFNIIDSDIIKINDDLDVQVSKIGETGHVIVTIDNFLKNPEDLVSIIEKYPIEKNDTSTDNPNSMGYFPGWTTSFGIKVLEIRKTFNYIAKKYYDINHIENLMYSTSIQINLLNGGIPLSLKSLHPHTDPSILAFSLYLNKDEDCNGGTAFYKHVKSNIDYDVSMFDEDFKKTENSILIQKTKEKYNKPNLVSILDSRLIDEEWEKTFMIKMKYNRIVFHPGYMFHGAYMHKEWFQDKKRVSLAGFLK
jgi:hypothetical protein